MAGLKPRILMSGAATCTASPRGVPVMRFAPAAGRGLIDLNLTLHCGQVFHWVPCGPGWAGHDRIATGLP
jgi:hypothetical protein